jgi:hypothetical protein
VAIACVGGSLSFAAPAHAQPAAESAPERAAESDPPDGDGAPALVTAADPDEDVLRYPPSSARVGLIVGGLSLTAVAYGLTALVATTWDDVPGADAMLVPVAGPWIALAQLGCSADDPDCGAILVLRAILLVIDGFAQAGGLGVAGEGLFMTTEADAPPPAASWHLTPNVGPHHAGVGVIGTF